MLKHTLALLVAVFALVMAAQVFALSTYQVVQGGTGAASFGQGWINSTGLNGDKNPLAA